jgi:hypothetical protein
MSLNGGIVEAAIENARICFALGWDGWAIPRVHSTVCKDNGVEAAALCK